jgi:uncharacterized membrane protein YgcG
MLTVARVRHRSRRSTLAIAAVLVVMSAGARAVLALDQPPVLRAPVTDLVDALTPDEEEEVTGNLARVRDEEGVQLFVTLVDTTGVQTAPEFTQATAEASSMGGNDAVLLVAFDDRSDALWVGPSLDGVTEDEIDAILTDHLEPSLAAGDTKQGLIDATDALGQAATGELAGGATGAPIPTVPPLATAAPGQGSGAPVQASDFLPTLAVLAVLAVLGVAFLVWRTRRATSARNASLAQLARDANRALLHADEALKDAANDVEFAAAQWGDQEVIPYREAIRTATAELGAAFSIRQRLDDADPETAEEREQLLREILARTSKASALLDEQERGFDQLRDLQAAAPAQLEAMPATIAAIRDRRQAADATLARLRSSYAAAAVAPVAGNLDEAEKALDAATAETDRGRGAVTAKPAAGVVALRRAQEAVARAAQLVDPVERLAASLDDAATRLPAELEAATKDVETAREAVTRLAAADSDALDPTTAPGPPAAPADAAGALRDAEAFLSAARQAASATLPDPVTALQRAVAANQAADAIVARVRDAEAQLANRRRLAASAVASAEGRVTLAEDFIVTRRHGVGETARTRAAEARLRLDEARSLMERDPQGAAAAANRAASLADEAYRLASGEFDLWNQGSGPVAGPYRQGTPGSDVAGAILGGVIGGILSGGGGRGSGWGGSPWGGPFGSPGTRGSAGGFGLPPGPFGGGGFGGGGGGGGGGRVRGGRW